MKSKLLIPFAILVAGCTTYDYQSVADMSKFYSDKLECETKYTQGYGVFGNRVYGDITKKGIARDCMLAKGYRNTP
jgi:hypothetical protein